MTAEFTGDVADYYSRYRRGYPDAVVSSLADALELDLADVLVDLGCGTGQLTVPLSRRVRQTIGVDPERDMLRHAGVAADRAGIHNIEWVSGSVEKLDSIVARYGPLGAITLANAIHLVDRTQLFRATRAALKPGRGLAIVANGTPLWLQPTAWSRSLRTFLEGWLHTSLTSCCGTDDETRLQYRTELTEMGYRVSEIRTDYTDTLTFEQVSGGVYSAMGSRLPARNERPAFESRLADALADSAPYVEHVSVRSLVARVQ